MELNYFNKTMLKSSEDALWNWTQLHRGQSVHRSEWRKGLTMRLHIHILLFISVIYDTQLIK